VFEPPMPPTAVQTFNCQLDPSDGRFLVFTFGMADGSARTLALVGEKAAWLHNEVIREQGNGAFAPSRRLRPAVRAARRVEFYNRRKLLPVPTMDVAIASTTVLDLHVEAGRDALRLDARTNGGDRVVLWMSDDVVVELVEAVREAIKLGLKQS